MDPSTVSRRRPNRKLREDKLYWQTAREEFSSTDPKFKVLGDQGRASALAEGLCTRCSGPMPMGHEVPPVPIGGMYEQIVKGMARLNEKLDKIVSSSV